ncbi:MAG TPA: response regulator [Phycisphaerales bacterium]|nr:response regulator [Phycisphaerales bacterium]
MDNLNASLSGSSTPESIDSLRQMNRQQQAALRAKGRLIDNMAYQIRTLSNAIIGFSDLLLSESLPPDHREYAEEINQAGKELSDLVNEVLDWARLESGRLQLVHTPCSISELLSRLDQAVRPAAMDKALDFEVHTEQPLPDAILTDSDRLLKCLINLADNAIQYTSEGFIRVAVRTENKDGQAFVRFDVTDSGQGIDEAQLATLFEPPAVEEQVHAEMFTMMNSGLSVTAGLPLTRQLVELLGGVLDVQSRTGKGSTFSLMIPAEQADYAELTPKSQPPPASPHPDGNRAETGHDGPAPILVVEDQASNRTVLRLMLKTKGYFVDTAEDGQQAVDMALAKRYSLIVMDLKMPRMNGYQATETLRDKGVKTPIVALSMLTLDPGEKERIDSLFDDFLCKPIDIEQIAAVAEKYAGRPATKTAATEIG